MSSHVEAVTVDANIDILKEHCENVALLLSPSAIRISNECVSSSKAAINDSFRGLPFSLPLMSSPCSLSALPSLSLTFYYLVSYCPSGLPPQSDTCTECVSIHQSCLTLTTPRTGKQPGNVTEAASCQRLSPPFNHPSPAPPPCHRLTHQTGSRPCWWEEIH